MTVPTVHTIKILIISRSAELFYPNNWLMVLMLLITWIIIWGYLLSQTSSNKTKKQTKFAKIWSICITVLTTLYPYAVLIVLLGKYNNFLKRMPYFLQCVIINKSDDKKTVRSRLEDSAVDYWAVHVGGTKNNNKHFYTMIKWF